MIPFMFNIILEQTLLWAMTQVQRATKMSVVFVRNLIMKMKRGFRILLARYGSIKNISENNFTANFKDILLKFRC